MPTYQYACRSCGHQFDIVQGFQDDALRTCPNCQMDELRKVFGNVGVVFKGSGFYRNDSRSGAKTGTAPTTAKSDGATTPSTSDAGSGSGSSSGSGDSAAPAANKTPASA